MIERASVDECYLDLTEVRSTNEARSRSVIVPGIHQQGHLLTGNEGEIFLDLPKNQNWSHATLQLGGAHCWSMTHHRHGVLRCHRLPRYPVGGCGPKAWIPHSCALICGLRTLERKWIRGHNLPVSCMHAGSYPAAARLCQRRPASAGEHPRDTHLWPGERSSSNVFSGWGGGTGKHV